MSTFIAVNVRLAVEAAVLFFFVRVEVVFFFKGYF